jgi:hypothetical protein
MIAWLPSPPAGDAYRKGGGISQVHNGVMKVAEKAVRQSVSLPPRLAKQVGSMAKSRKVSKNRILLELIENGIDAEKRKQQQFFALAERFRNEQDQERPTAWAMNSAEWSSAASAANRALGEPA